MTLSSIELELYRRLNFASSPATEVTTRLRAFVNSVHRQLASLPGMELVRDSTISFASVADIATYGLPQSVGRIRTIHDRTNDRRLTLATLDQLRSADPGLDASGTPASYIVRGTVAANRQPSNASEIFVDSTDAGDTGTAFVEVIRTGGYVRLLSVTMTGVTAVSLSTAITDIIEVTKFYLSAAAVGTVTLHEDASGGTELSRIPIGQTHARYVGVQLYPTPSSAITFFVDHQRNIEDLVNANDEPLLPEDFHDLLVLGAERLEYRRREQLDREASTLAEYTQRVRQFKYFLQQADELLVSGRPGLHRLSRLGSWFPAGAGWD